MKRILVINPNTNPVVTGRVREVAEQLVSAEVAIDVVSPPAGPFSIESERDRREAESQVVALVREKAPQHYAAYVMACFDDLALDTIRALVREPVVSTCEAGIASARRLSPRFAIVTTVHDAVAGIRLLMVKYGAGPQASVRASGIGVAQAADAGVAVRQRIAQTARDAAREDGAEAILLASGGLTGQAPDLAQSTGMPVVDGVEAAIRQAVWLVTSLNREMAPR